jgi:hypothetical protein
MPRQRFIWPDLWDDKDLGGVSELAFILYVGCFSLADDEGRIIGDPVHLKSQICRWRDVSIEDVRAARNELERASDAFCVYEVTQIEYVALLNWADWQRPKYPSPSRLPAPPKTAQRKYSRQNSSRKPSPKTSPSGSGRDSPNDSSTGRVGLSREDLSTKQTALRDATPTADFQNGQEQPIRLTPSDAHDIQRLCALIHDRDENTARIIAGYATGLPQVVLEHIMESLKRHPDRGAGWVINALKDEARIARKETATT